MPKKLPNAANYELGHRVSYDQNTRTGGSYLVAYEVAAGAKGLKVWKRVNLSGKASKPRAYKRKPGVAARQRYPETKEGAEEKFVDYYTKHSKTLASAKSAMTRDNQHRSKFATSVSSYRPRGQDWPGVDDTGTFFSGKRKKKWGVKELSLAQRSALASGRGDYEGQLQMHLDEQQRMAGSKRRR